MDEGYEILEKVKEIQGAQEEMEETLERIRRNQDDDEGCEILEKVKEIREAQEEMEEQLDTIKYQQQDVKETVEVFDSRIKQIQSTVDNIENEVNDVATKLEEIVENQEKLFNLQNKIFQILQQQHGGTQWCSSISWIKRTFWWRDCLVFELKLLQRQLVTIQVSTKLEKIKHRLEAC